MASIFWRYQSLLLRIWTWQWSRIRIPPMTCSRCSCQLQTLGMLGRRGIEPMSFAPTKSILHALMTRNGCWVWFLGGWNQKYRRFPVITSWLQFLKFNKRLNNLLSVERSHSNHVATTWNISSLNGRKMHCVPMKRHTLMNTDVAPKVTLIWYFF